MTEQSILQPSAQADVPAIAIVEPTAAGAAPIPYQLMTADRCHPQRAEVQQFIAAGFERSYGASISNFMPYLLALKSDAIQACLGVRPATETLFVEQYLDQPIETAAPALAIPREQIVEIGNLVSESRHATLKLFMTATLALHNAGYRELVFCATRKVAAIIRQTGAQLHAIVDADGKRLGTSLSEWGSYYDTRPVVMRLNLASVAQLIESTPLLLRHTRGHRADIAAMAAQLRVEMPCAGQS